MNKPMTKEEWGASVAETFGLAVKSAYEDMIDAAVAAEREACAMAAKDSLQRLGVDWAITEAVMRDIRARGEKK
jgi:hypothetical protein